MTISSITVITDVDGTLVQRGVPPTAKVIDSIRFLRRNGVRVVLASGRPPVSIRHLLAQLGAQLPYVASNGNYVSEGEPCQGRIASPFNQQLIMSCLATATAHDAGAVFSGLDNENRCTTPHLWLDAILQSYDEAPCKLTDAGSLIASAETILHCHLIRGEGWTAKPVVPEATCRTSEPEYVTITPIGVTKASGVKLLLGESTTCVVIGDGDNDLPLFEMTGALRVAIDGGHPELLKVADHVAPPVSRDGFCWTVEEIIKPLMMQGAVNE